MRLGLASVGTDDDSDERTIVAVTVGSLELEEEGSGCGAEEAPGAQENKTCLMFAE